MHKIPEKPFDYNESWLQHPTVAHENSTKDEAEISTILDHTEDLIEKCRDYMEFLTEKETVESMCQLRRVNSMLEDVMVRLHRKLNDKRDSWVIVQEIHGKEYIVGNRIWHDEMEADQAYRNALSAWFKQTTYKDNAYSHFLFQPRLRKVQWIESNPTPLTVTSNLRNICHNCDCKINNDKCNEKLYKGVCHENDENDDDDDDDSEDDDSNDTYE